MTLIPEACFFTGHRVLENVDIDEVRIILKQEVLNMIDRGVTVFICGGALGFDTLCAQTVLEVKRDFDVKLVMYIPCDDQPKGWDQDDVDEYIRIMIGSDEVFFVNHGSGSPLIMRKRNKAMVEASDYCIAYMSNPSSGTGQTVRMAEEKGIEIINIYEKIKERL